jgi:hypothetical protein
MTIDFLDKALMYIKNQASFIPTKSDVPEFTEQENRLLVRAFYKLEKDGYVYTDTKVDDKGNKTVRFYISFDGLLALENNPFFWKNRPYRWNANKKKLDTIWTVAKIIAIIINAIIIIVFTYLTYYKKP